MNTISYQELRDGYEAVMDSLERGESFMLTRNGVPVGEVRPYRERRKTTAAELVEAVRKLPPIDYEEMRAEGEAFFGDDRIDDDPWERARGRK
ncbi:type II toxin-antitoxin system Phd/YefM family antitoxin [Glycomyces arizonensis]|uniref:type II toxin-antitoxin system Phd/YefM family antitoxin n=1 Tax=Glycomyces arizonensis TaxID=256035 RepID=UPI000402D814|nr:type II toxin-antitoxin system Phd/YefM family antitoxin [Glycomyces arizonensis]